MGVARKRKDVCVWRGKGEVWVNQAVVKDQRSTAAWSESVQGSYGKRQKAKDLAGRADEGHDAAVPLASAAADASSRYPANGQCCQRRLDGWGAPRQRCKCLTFFIRWVLDA